MLHARSIRDADAGRGQARGLQPGTSHHLGRITAALFPPLTAPLFCAVILASWTSIQTLPRLVFRPAAGTGERHHGRILRPGSGAVLPVLELTLVPIYFLISLWGIGPERRFAAIKYTLFMLAGGIPLLFAILLLGSITPAPWGVDPRRIVVRLPDAARTAAVSLGADRRLSAAVFRFCRQGSAVSVSYLVADRAAGGSGGPERVAGGSQARRVRHPALCLLLAPTAARECFWLMAVLGGFGALYGALVALRQSNLRKMLAFSSVSHVGLVIVGIAAMNSQGIQGAIFQLLNFEWSRAASCC